MSRINFGSWQPVVDAAPGRAKDYYLAKFDLNSTLDVDQICREMNDEEWDYVESNAGSVCCKIGMRRRRERMQGQPATGGLRPSSRRPKRGSKPAG